MTPDLISLLSEGDKRTVSNVDKVVDLVFDTPDLADDLVECLTSTDEILAMHSADALQKLHVARPAIIEPYAQKLFDALLRTKQQEVQWHLAQMLPSMPIPIEQLAKAVSVWLDNFYTSESSIVKTFSMQAVHDSLDRLPEFHTKYMEMLRFAVEKGTPAMQARAKKLLELDG